MPPIPVIQSIIGAGASLLGGAVDAGATSNMNKRNRTFAKHMYEQQYRDSIAFWNMQNQYNTPSAQMARFKAAGLNPHLIYGQGNPGNAGLPPVPDQQRVNFEAPRTGEYISAAGGRLADVFDFRLKQAQTNNLERQNEVIAQDVLLRSAQIANTIQGTERSKYDLELQKDLRSTVLEAASENVRKLRIENQVTQNRDVREAVMNAATVEQIAENILNLRSTRELTNEQLNQVKATVANLRKDGILKDWEISLAKKGLRPGDPLWSRAFSDIFQQVVDGAKYGVRHPTDVLKFAWKSHLQNLQNLQNEVYKTTSTHAKAINKFFNR